MTATFTDDHYTTKIAELKTLFMDLKEENLNPKNINVKICQVQRNYNRVIELAIEALDNKVIAARQLRSAKLMYDMAYSSAMLNDDVKAAGSADLRKAKAQLMVKKEDGDVNDATYVKDKADSYFDAVKMMYDDLEMAYQTLKEQVKLFQNMLYLDANRGG